MRCGVMSNQDAPVMSNQATVTRNQRQSISVNAHVLLRADDDRAGSCAPSGLTVELVESIPAPGKPAGDEQAESSAPSGLTVEPVENRQVISEQEAGAPSGLTAELVESILAPVKPAVVGLGGSIKVLRTLASRTPRHPAHLATRPRPATRRTA